MLFRSSPAPSSTHFQGDTSRSTYVGILANKRAMLCIFTPSIRVCKSHRLFCSAPDLSPAPALPLLVSFTIHCNVTRHPHALSFSLLKPVLLLEEQGKMHHWSRQV
jgi:hypothetical protein